MRKRPNGPVALHIDFRRFKIVLLQAGFERRQIKAAVLGPESVGKLLTVGLFHLASSLRVALSITLRDTGDMTKVA